MASSGAGRKVDAASQEEENTSRQRRTVKASQAPLEKGGKGGKGWRGPVDQPLQKGCPAQLPLGFPRSGKKRLLPTAVLKAVLRAAGSQKSPMAADKGT